MRRRKAVSSGRLQAGGAGGGGEERLSFQLSSECCEDQNTGARLPLATRLVLDQTKSRKQQNSLCRGFNSG
jgi:hypothetical protein